MPKLRKPSLPKTAVVLPSYVERQLTEMQRRLVEKDYRGVVEVGQKLLPTLPAQSPQRAETLHYLSNAYGLLKRFEEAYQAGLETVRIDRNESIYWFNSGTIGAFHRTHRRIVDLLRARRRNSGDAGANQARGRRGRSSP